MAYVVTENCVICKHTDYVDICRVDRCYQGPDLLVIDPDECIDRGMCEPECPVNAVKSQDNLRQDEHIFEQLNRELSSIWLNISRAKVPSPDAEKLAHMLGNLEFLQR